MDENNNEKFNCTASQYASIEFLKFENKQNYLKDSKHNLELLKNKIERQSIDFFYQNKIDFLENQLGHYKTEKNLIAIRNKINYSSLKQKIVDLEDKLRLKNDEFEREKNLRLYFVEKIIEQEKYISKLELEKSVLENHLAEMENNINHLNTNNLQLMAKIDDLNLNYSKYFNIENENKLIFEALHDIDKANSDSLFFDELNDIDHKSLISRYKSLIDIFYSQKKILSKVEAEFTEKKKENASQIEKLALQNDEFMTQFHEIQRKNWTLQNDLKTAIEYRDMALKHSEKMAEKLESFEFALTDEYKRSMKEFYRELNMCIDTMIKLVNYSHDVFNKKSKSIMDVSALNTPTLFDEKKWDPNLLFKKEFWVNETKKLRDLNRNYIDLKIKYHLIALTDID
ncbi:hypothetical protein BpHYR1_014588 [Brachionus plicatilis]|uniref:Uncharacterized protein n=1 Tax=Brachionus plicatilis TaxID=10195 RepID=A0A3M7PV57_BRAPC|nr:hypothetical protein BpHYR1_014588 [Brachionus plicatilis]